MATAEIQSEEVVINYKLIEKKKQQFSEGTKILTSYHISLFQRQVFTHLLHRVLTPS